jgi:beta-lactamase regulating signal transducer with metallopeptidase domain
MPGDSLLITALWVALKASALLSIAAAAQLVWRRRASAAARHVVWTLGLFGVLILPIASAVAPRWPVIVRPGQTAVAPAVVHDDSNAPAAAAESSSSPTRLGAGVDEPRSFGITWTSAVVLTYASGVVLLLLLLVVQHLRLWQFARRATVVDNQDWAVLLAECAGRLGLTRRVRLLRTRERNVPMAFGTLRPSILIPAVADAWNPDRRRAVLLHELAHVVRHDCLTHTVAAIACAAYWFHPGVWWVARRARVERELACDDRVIAAGTEPREYAGHLLEIAYSFGAHRAPALAVTMARPRQLEGRMLAAIDAARNRALPSGRARVVGAAVSGLLLLGLAGLRPTVVDAVPADDARGGGRWPVARDSSLLSASDSSPMQAKTTAKTLKKITWPSLRELAAAPADVSRAVIASVGALQEGSAGTWEIRVTDEKDTVHLRLVEANSSSGTNVPLARLKGLTAAQLTGAGGPVQFRLERDAGIFTFEGVIRNGVGAGTFAFAPDAKFPDELAKRGFSRPTAREQYQLARHDVGYTFIDELNAQGYAKPQTSDLVRAGQHGVNTTYLREMAALGYRLGSLDPLITLRDHGVTPAYVRELADNGYKGLSADNLREARDHGVTADYVRGMRDGGYGSLPMDQLIKIRDHGITPEFVRELGDAGHRKLPLDQLLRVRDHGVSPEYVRDMRSLGYGLSVDELVRARDHGVTVDYVRGMAALGYGKQPMDALIRVRDHGVTTEYAQDLKALGYDKLDIEELVALRDHGLTPDRIRAANARAGTRLPIDMLKSLAAGGMR